MSSLGRELLLLLPEAMSNRQRLEFAMDNWIIRTTDIFESVIGQSAVPLWTAVAAISAALTIVVTAWYARQTVRLMKEQSAPRIRVFLRHTHERPTLIYIVIKNVGGDTARSIRFTSNRPIPAQAFGLVGHAVKSTLTMTEGPLIHGIPALGPGEERELLWGQPGGLLLALQDGPITISHSYDNGEKESFVGKDELELSSFLGTDASEAPISVVANELKKMARSLGSIERHHAQREQRRATRARRIQRQGPGEGHQREFSEPTHAEVVKARDGEGG